MSYNLQAISSSVFRAYDIRGVISKNFSEDAFYTIGKAVASRLKSLDRSQIFIGRDGRLTSESLALALKQGLLDSGITVVDLGQVATPIMYYATCEHGIDSGLMVTGSHNPAEYNGIKLVLAGKTLINTDIDILNLLVKTGAFPKGPSSEKSLEIVENYIQRVIEGIHIQRPLKVVVDCGNGVAGPVIPKALERLGCEVIPLYCEVDGNFPNHHPDPTIEANLEDLKKAVSLTKADIGLAFDGDADRLGVVTNKGTMIWPDRLMMYYVTRVLKEKPGSTIVFDVKCSAHLAKVIEANGGIAIMCPTGHSIVKDVMKKSSAALAGEMSGHLFFKDRWYGFDDALYSACRLLEYMSQSPLSIEEQFAVIPDSVNTPELKIAIHDDKKFDFMEKFCSTADFSMANIIRIDGLRAEFEFGWGLVRASNTTPCLVARFEAYDLSSLEKIKHEFKAQLLKIDQSLVLPF